MVQVSLVAEPGQCTYHCDCQSVVTAVHEGMAQATSAKNRYAMVYIILQNSLGDTPAEKTLWMPAHGKGTDKSDGSLVYGQDREANDLADTHAKAAVETHRLQPDTIERWKLLKATTKAMAMWTARVTAEANNHALAPSRDSTASKAKGDEARRKRAPAKQLLKAAGGAGRRSVCSGGAPAQQQRQRTTITARPTQLGGKLLIKLEGKSGERSG